MTTTMKWIGLLFLSMLVALVLPQLSAHAWPVQPVQTIVSLAGDKDNFGTGAPLGSPLNSGIGINGVPINPDPGETAFDYWKTKDPVTWLHTLNLPPCADVIGATLTIVTWDLEDGGAGDGNGGAPYDTRLYLNGVELVGAFDDTYSPDVGPSLPNTTTFVLAPSFLPLLQNGSLQVTLNPSGGSYADAISIDYAELTIQTAGGAPVPEPSTLLLLGSGLAGLGGMAWRRHRRG